MKFIEKLKMDLTVRAYDEYKVGLLSLLEENKDGALLDLGCSYGKFLKQIAGEVKPKKIVGVDMDEVKIEEARKREFEIVKCDLNNLFPFRNESFDVVIASQIIEHLNDTDQFTKEVYRVLKPTGYAIISTPNLAAWHNILYLILGKQPETAIVSEEMHPENEKPGHRRIFTATELVRFLEFHKFIVEGVIGSTYHPLPTKLARIACRLDRRHSSTITVKVRRLR